MANLGLHKKAGVAGAISMAVAIFLLAAIVGINIFISVVLPGQEKSHTISASIDNFTKDYAFVVYERTPISPSSVFGVYNTLDKTGISPSDITAQYILSKDSQQRTELANTLKLSFGSSIGGSEADSDAYLKSVRTN